LIYMCYSIIIFNFIPTKFYHPLSGSNEHFFTARFLIISLIGAIIKIRIFKVKLVQLPTTTDTCMVSLWRRWLARLLQAAESEWRQNEQS